VGADLRRTARGSGVALVKERVKTGCDERYKSRAQGTKGEGEIKQMEISQPDRQGDGRRLRGQTGPWETGIVETGIGKTKRKKAGHSPSTGAAIRSGRKENVRIVKSKTRQNVRS